MDIFNAFFSRIDDMLSTFFNVAIENVITAAAPWAITLAYIYIIFSGISMLFATGKMSPPEWIKSVTLIAIVTHLSSSAGQYNEYLGDYLRALPDAMMALSTLPTAGSGLGFGATLDGIIENGLDGFSALWATAGLMDFGIVFIAVLLFAALVLFSIGAAITLIVSKVGLTVVVALGPVLLPTLFFEATRDMFTKWLTYAFSFAALAFLIGGVMSMASFVVSDYLQAMLLPRENFDPALYFAPIAILGILTYLFSQLPNMASSLTGGIAVSAGGAISRASNTAMAPVRRVVGERVAANRSARMTEKTKAARQRRRPKSPNGGGSIRR